MAADAALCTCSSTVVVIVIVVVVVVVVVVVICPLEYPVDRCSGCKRRKERYYCTGGLLALVE